MCIRTLRRSSRTRAARHPPTLEKTGKANGSVRSEQSAVTALVRCPPSRCTTNSRGSLAYGSMLCLRIWTRSGMTEGARLIVRYVHVADIDSSSPGPYAAASALDTPRFPLLSRDATSHPFLSLSLISVRIMACPAASLALAILQLPRETSPIACVVVSCF